MEEVPHRTSLAPLASRWFVLWLAGVETEGLLDYRGGGGGDHVHCMVEPGPSQIRCRFFSGSFVMRCAKGVFAKGIFGCPGFSLLRWEKGSETSSCDGEKGLRLPRSLCRSMRNEGVSDPFSHRKRESQTLFPLQKGKPRTSENPLSENPLSATHHFGGFSVWRCSGIWKGILAHRNRSNFCDLRLRCPSRTPEIATDFRDKRKQCCIAI